MSEDRTVQMFKSGICFLREKGNFLLPKMKKIILEIQRIAESLIVHWIPLKFWKFLVGKKSKTW